MLEKLNLVLHADNQKLLLVSLILFMILSLCHSIYFVPIHLRREVILGRLIFDLPDIYIYSESGIYNKIR